MLCYCVCYCVRYCVHECARYCVKEVRLKVNFEGSLHYSEHFRILEHGLLSILLNIFQEEEDDLETSDEEFDETSEKNQNNKAWRKNSKFIFRKLRKGMSG